ncbi:YafY family transcriptional regulator [Rhodococcoides fascians A25f]|uniref:helix-turn-helix transcriptional regulator n=1 Tax=Rhodococcoides fascians TaxID=1828 RepID=UPI000566565D|nr:YafY family protein [Rhodococcus fascians]QII04856.1 YafY family transcriptional regulator [Rhodococcus fascians A25f]
MRSARLLRIMLLLQQGRTATAQSLADQVEVSVRTIYRDIGALGAAGVPLWTETGPGGGIRLLDGWQSALTGMTGIETSALMLLGMPSIAADLGLSDVTAAAESKLLGALPVPLRASAQLWRERVHVDVPGWFTVPAANDVVPVLARAVLGGREIEMAYRGGRRVVGPLGLVVKASVWYLVATRGERVLSFRVDRIGSVTESKTPVVRPEGFDLAQWWNASMAEFDRSLLTYACRVRLSDSAIRALPRVIGATAMPATAPPDDDGWTTVDLMLESEEVALGQLIALGGGVRVLEPTSLRISLRDLASNIALDNG